MEASSGTQQGPGMQQGVLEGSLAESRGSSACTYGIQSPGHIRHVCPAQSFVSESQNYREMLRLQPSLSVAALGQVSVPQL